jgi:hypothetical protein
MSVYLTQQTHFRFCYYEHHHHHYYCLACIVVANVITLDSNQAPSEYKCSKLLGV